MTLKHVLKHFSKTEVQEDKNHPTYLSQTILNRLFGRVLEKEGVNVSCAEHTVKDLSSNRLSVLTTSKKAAFTLAEVLITLGIIGVVAAVTLPTLISNHKKQVYVTQLKKSVSTLEQAFQLALADSGVDELGNTDLFLSIGEAECNMFNDSNSQACSQFYTMFKKYIKIVDVKKNSDYKYSYIKKGSTPIYPQGYTNNYIISLADGSLIFSYRFFKEQQTSSYTCDFIKSQGGIMCAKSGFLTIDVNGKKGPNIEGRDSFSFYIASNGKLVPYWSKSDLIFAEGSDARAWYNTPTACGTKGVADAEEKSTYGSGCAARIIDNGWVMDY